VLVDVSHEMSNFNRIKGHGLWQRAISKPQCLLKYTLESFNVSESTNPEKA
jgi:hypothetical protein